METHVKKIKQGQSSQQLPLNYHLLGSYRHFLNIFNSQHFKVFHCSPCDQKENISWSEWESKVWGFCHIDKFTCWVNLIGGTNGWLFQNRKTTPYQQHNKNILVVFDFSIFGVLVVFMKEILLSFLKSYMAASRHSPMQIFIDTITVRSESE